jgi:hypothetical protein
MARLIDPLPRLIKECVRDVGLSILVGIGLMLASVVNAGSINPTLTFQQDPQHTEYNGLAQVILKEAYRRIGHPVSTSLDNADLAHLTRAHSSADGVLIAPKNSQLQKDYIRIPVAIVNLKVFAYAHKSHEHTRYEFGLLGNRVSIVKGMPMIQNNMMGMMAIQMNSVNNSIKSILRNQADLVLLPEFCALSRSKKHLREQVTALQPAVYEIPMYHYVSKKNQHLAHAIQRSLQGMQKQQLISHVTRSYKHVLEADAEA